MKPRGSMSIWMRLAAVAAFVVGYFVILRWLRVLIAGVMVFPMASAIDADRDNGYRVFYEAGSTGVYVYAERYLGVGYEVSGVDSGVGISSGERAGEAVVDALSGDGSSGGTVGGTGEGPAGGSVVDSVEGPVVDSVDGPVGMASSFGDKPFYLFKGFGDQFFLLGGVILLGLGFVRHVGYLFAYHVGISVLNIGLLAVGLFGFEFALRLMDFNIAYLTPAVSMLWVVMVYGTRVRE